MTEPRPLAGKTLFITGATRGIGHAIGLRAAADGANIVIAAKTATPHPTLPGTIHSAAEEMIAAGGQALAVTCDIRFEDQIEAAVAAAARRFGAIDIVVNNASAITLTGTLATEPKRLDLMLGINTRGTYLVSRAAIPHLLKAANPHILTLSPPISMEPRWFANHPAYTMSKYAMSLVTYGLAAEFPTIAVNSLWPATVIDTAALRMIPGGAKLALAARTPAIVADAAHAILSRPAQGQSGQFLVDEAVLREAGVTDFARYAVDPSRPPVPDFFL